MLYIYLDVQVRQADSISGPDDGFCEVLGHRNHFVLRFLDQ